MDVDDREAITVVKGVVEMIVKAGAMGASETAALEFGFVHNAF